MDSSELKAKLEEMGYIVSLWDDSDLQQQANDSLGRDLTEDELIQVKEKINENFDANNGINWEVINIAIHDVVNENK